MTPPWFTLPQLPEIDLELLEDVSPEQPSGFLKLVRRRLRARYPGGRISEVFSYDAVDRKSIDATVIAAHYLAGDGQRWVYLRSALRPPLVFRDPATTAGSLATHRGGLWELPAGLVEPEEQSLDGIARSAARELEEEIGFALPPSALAPLGPSMLPCPGVIAERHFFFEVEVNPADRGEPNPDGPLECSGVVVPLPLISILAHCNSGAIEDAKTELALRRLAERYG